MDEYPHVVILGAGFAGAGALKAMRRAPVRVTLVDRNPYQTFLPLLYQVATGELRSEVVAYPAADLLRDRRDWRSLQAEVRGVDISRRQILFEGRDPLAYDYLIFGLGAVANYFGTKGAAEHGFPLYSIRDAERLKAHVVERLRAAQAQRRVIDDGALTFCVVGGGATGVEISGALSELLCSDLGEDFPGLQVERAAVHLYELGPNLLAPFKPHLKRYAHRALLELGVTVHLGEGVSEVERTRVRLRSGGVVKTHTLIWAAGITANPLVNSLAVELEHGRVPVKLDLSLRDHPEVFAAGDSALITDANTGKALPQLGSVALQAGQRAGDNVVRVAAGQRALPFRYEDKGTMATIGHGAAVVQFRRGRTMTGRAAWLAWLGVHLMLLSGGHEKSATISDWGLEILTHERRYRAVA